MIIERLRAVLARDEGCRLEVYYLNNIPHIGYGVNLINGLSDAQLEYLGVEDEDDIEVITQEQADYLLEDHIIEYTDVCAELFGDHWNNISSERQEVLVNIAFNVGAAGIRKFRRMIASVNNGDWKTASDELLNSRAARQTGKRYNRLSNVMASGDEVHFEIEYKVLEDKNEATQATEPVSALDDQVVAVMFKTFSTLESDMAIIKSKLDEILKQIPKRKSLPTSSGFLG